jgi:hypothetical protein
MKVARRFENLVVFRFAVVTAAVLSACGTPPLYLPQDGGGTDSGDASTIGSSTGGRGNGGASGSGGLGPTGGGGNGVGGSGGTGTGSGGNGDAGSGSAAGNGNGSGGSGGAGGQGASSAGRGGTGGRIGVGGAGSGGSATGGAGTGGRGTGGSATGGAGSGGRGTGGSATGGRGTGGAGTGGAPKANGQSCGNNNECMSTRCVEGFCCDGPCTGQCESCATANNRGTCVPVTTPRTACAGSGTCAGRCDGTAANRASCVYPSSTTSCGAAATCTNNMARTEPLCNGSGACTPSSTMSCMFGCRTDGVAACATSCPSMQGLCGGSCVDIQSTPAHCGTSCRVCQGNTPKCFQGNCVQCLAGGDCTISGQACTTNHTCVCRPPSAGNLLQNPGFEQSPGVANWSPTTGATWSSADADGCPGSGSVKVAYTGGFFGMVSQCVAATAGTRYFFGYDYNQDSALGVVCHLYFYAGPTCSGSGLVNGALTLAGAESVITTWVRNSGSITAPTGTGSAGVYCQEQGAGSGNIDQVYLNATSNSY